MKEKPKINGKIDSSKTKKTAKDDNSNTEESKDIKKELNPEDDLYANVLLVSLQFYNEMINHYLFYSRFIF